MERIQAAIEKARALRENQPLPDPDAAPVAAPEAKAKTPAAKAKSTPKNGAFPAAQTAEAAAPPAARA